MTKTPFLILAAALALSACANPDRFQDTAPAPITDQTYGNGVGTTTLDPANDPKSPVYFQKTIGDRVLFVVDSSTLTAAGMSTLDGQARWLLANTDYLAVIEGHADEQGTREYNQSLGARRANAVREYLISKGVPANRLRTISYGKERPIAVCSEESCYAKNRRAVTIISAGGLS